MSSETQNLQQEINEASLIRELTASEAWAVLSSHIDTARDILEHERKTSDDINVVFACSKKMDGVDLILETIVEIVSRGTTAERQLSGDDPE